MIRWRSQTDATDGIASADGKVFVFGGESATCLDLVTGDTLWSVSAPRSNGPVPVAVDDDIITARFQDRTVGFAVETGEARPPARGDADLSVIPRVQQSAAQQGRKRRAVHGSWTLVTESVSVKVEPERMRVLDQAGRLMLELNPEASNFEPSPPVLNQDGSVAFTDASGVTWCIDISAPPPDARPHPKGNVLLRALAGIVRVSPTEPLGVAVFAEPPEQDEGLRRDYIRWYCEDALDAALAHLEVAKNLVPIHRGFSEERFAALVTMEERIAALPEREASKGADLAVALLRAVEAPQPYHFDNLGHEIRRNPHAHDARLQTDQSLCRSLGYQVGEGLGHHLFGDWDGNDPRFLTIPRRLRLSRRGTDDLGRALILAADKGTPLGRARPLRDLRWLADNHIGPTAFDDALEAAGITGANILKARAHVVEMSTMASTAAVMVLAASRSSDEQSVLASLRRVTREFIRVAVESPANGER